MYICSARALVKKTQEPGIKFAPGDAIFFKGVYPNSSLLKVKQLFWCLHLCFKVQ